MAYPGPVSQQTSAAAAGRRHGYRRGRSGRPSGLKTVSHRTLPPSHRRARHRDDQRALTVSQGSLNARDQRIPSSTSSRVDHYRSSKLVTGPAAWQALASTSNTTTPLPAGLTGACSSEPRAATGWPSKAPTNRRFTSPADQTWTKRHVSCESVQLPNGGLPRAHPGHRASGTRRKQRELTRGYFAGQNMSRGSAAGADGRLATSSGSARIAVRNSWSLSRRGGRAP